MQLHRLSLRRLTRFDLLTRREQEVASLLADGKSHKEAARILSVAPATIRNQTQSIYSKMGVASRAELAVEVNRGRAG
jgi:DNA-binding NarL/FixJ family response regulator